MDTEFLAVRSYETRPPARGAPSSDDKRQAADQNRQQDARADTIPPAEERDGGFSLATYPANAAERRLALWAVIVSAAVFAVIAPFAKVKLAQVWAFIPAYQSALVINDLITAALLFGQYSHFRSRALLVLSCGYLFTASLAIVHALSFPASLRRRDC